MQFRDGADVYTADGDKVGDISHVVMNPDSKEVTHILVEHGFIFTEDHVVPVEFIQSATEERVTLRSDIPDFEDFPEYEETHYVPAVEPAIEAETGVEYDEASPTPGHVPPVYWYPPVSTYWWRSPYYMGYPSYYPAPPYFVSTQENIPEGTVALEEGAKVISNDGENVGDVERVFADPDDGRVTHLVIAEGLLFTEKRLIPSTWVSWVGEDEIHLSVNQEQLEGLPEFEEEA